MHRPPRGSALLLTVVVVLIVSVLGVGLLRMAFRETAAARAGARAESLAACAEAARQLLVAQFTALGLQPTSIDALEVPLDGAAGSSGSMALGGHYDSAGTASSGLSVTVSQVTYLPDSSFGPSSRVRDLSNVVAVAGQGGRPLKVVVHCQQAGGGVATAGRQLELEFGVRFGL